MSSVVDSHTCNHVVDTNAEAFQTLVEHAQDHKNCAHPSTVTVSFAGTDRTITWKAQPADFAAYEERLGQLAEIQFGRQERPDGFSLLPLLYSLTGQGVDESIMANAREAFEAANAPCEGEAIPAEPEAGVEVRVVRIEIDPDMLFMLGLIGALQGDQ